MRRPNSSLRVAIVAAFLVLALGATQAAVLPQAKDVGGDRTFKAGPRAHFHGFLDGVSKFFRLGQWLMVYPTAPPAPVPPSSDTETLGAPQRTMETTARPITDDGTPM